MRIPPKKSLGQNFLTDPYYLRRIIEAAHVGLEDQVVEIGPGLGHLTRELMTRAGRLFLIELDDRLIDGLRKEFSSSRVEITHADALVFDYGCLSGRWKVVANLPYYIATPLIERLLSFRCIFTSLTLMLQKEVAERIAAAPGTKKYGHLSVLVQAFAIPRIEFIVPAHAFSPKPKVDSAVITLTLRETPEVTNEKEPLFRRIVSAAFSQRRKTLRNSLKHLNLSNDFLEQAAKKTGIDLNRRAETLTVREFVLLTEAMSKT